MTLLVKFVTRSLILGISSCQTPAAFARFARCTNSPRRPSAPSSAAGKPQPASASARRPCCTTSASAFRQRRPARPELISDRSGLAPPFGRLVQDEARAPVTDSYGLYPDLRGLLKMLIQDTGTHASASASTTAPPARWYRNSTTPRLTPTVTTLRERGSGAILRCSINAGSGAQRVASESTGRSNGPRLSRRTGMVTVGLRSIPTWLII